jgi:hypothetical protein
MSCEATRHVPGLQPQPVLRFNSRRARVMLRELRRVTRFVNRYGHFVRPNAAERESLDGDQLTFDNEDTGWHQRHGPIPEGARIIPFNRLESARRTGATSKMPQSWGNFLMRSHDWTLAASLEQQRNLVEHPDIVTRHVSPAAKTGARPAPKTPAHPFSAHYHLHCQDEDPA